MTLGNQVLSATSSQQILERFLIDNLLLNELKGRIAEFNVFEAVGMVHRELRHSDFLAFLLNPAQKHDLKDRFLKAFLIRALQSSPVSITSPLAIELADLSEAQVERESQNIDVLINDPASGIVCIIENKLLSGEHSDQLNRYLQIVARRFPHAKITIPIFLTPDGSRPSDPESSFISLSYGDIVQLIETTQRIEGSRLNSDLSTFMRHYVGMLRRYVVSNSDIAELCRRIYQQHKAAIDLIIEHIPDMRQTLSEQVAAMVSESPAIRITRSAKSIISFYPAEIGEIPLMNVGNGWTGNSKVVQFDLVNSTDSLTLYLELGPVRDGYDEVRMKLFEAARQHPQVFIGCRPKLSPKWSYLFKLNLLSKNDYSDATIDDLLEIIRPKWRRFLDHNLPQITEVLAALPLETPTHQS